MRAEELNEDDFIDALDIEEPEEKEKTEKTKQTSKQVVKDSSKRQEITLVTSQLKLMNTMINDKTEDHVEEHNLFFNLF